MRRIKEIAEQFSHEFGSHVFASARIFSSWETDEVICVFTREIILVSVIFYSILSSGHHGRIVSELGNSHGLCFCHNFYSHCEYVRVCVGSPLRGFDFGKIIFEQVFIYST